jgi:hypothetical protein
MSNRLNKTVKKGEKMRKEAHLNWMGGPSYDIKDPFFKLTLAASSSFFGEPQYYHHDEKGKKSKEIYNGKAKTLSGRDIDHLRKTLDAIDPQEWRGWTPQQIMENTIDECLDKDIERTLQVAVSLRNEHFIRVTPQVIMVRAAMHPKSKGTGLIAKYAQDIMTRADEPATQLAYFTATYGKNGRRGKTPIPSALRKAWKKKLESLNDYQLAKYRLENHTVKTVDVVRLVHAHSPVITKLVKDELRSDSRTWNDIVSNKGSNESSWREALGVMPHMALLRNIRNLVQNDIPPREFLDKLKSGVAHGKQLPFRYYSAYNATKGISGISPQVLDGIEECLNMSIDNCPQFKGRTMSLVDNSGSAHGAFTSEAGTMSVAQIGNLTGVLTGMASEEGHVGVFGDRLETFPVRRTSSVFDMADKANHIGGRIGGGTEHGIWLFWDKAIKEKQHWDQVFVYSDMQAGHGGLYGTSGYSNYVWPGGGRYIDVPKLIAEYRAKVNPNVKVFLVQIAGYTDTLVPEYYKDTYILGGWGPGILKFAAEMANLSDQSQTEQVEQVEQTKPKRQKRVKKTDSSQSDIPF